MSSRILFLGIITCLAIAAAAGVGLELDPEVVYPGTLTENGDLVLYGRQRRGGQPAAIAAASGSSDQPPQQQHQGAAPSDVKWTLGLGKRAADFTPYLSLGVLSNMQQFFDSLRTNLESLETLPQEEKEALLGQTPVTSNIPEQDRTLRPKATAAYLHALRNHRPTQKMRNFVNRAEPAALRTNSQYDPNWLWNGLGRKR